MTTPIVLGSHIITANPTSITAPAGAKLLLGVSHCVDNVEGTTPTGITWNGVALTKEIDRDEAFVATAIWKLASPAVGTYDLGWSGGLGVRSLMAVWLSRINGGAPIRATNSGQSAGATGLTTTVTSTGEDIVVYGISVFRNEALTPNSLTELQEDTNPSGHGALGYEVGEGASSTGGWSWLSSGAVTLVGASVVGAPGGGGQILILGASRWQGLLRDLKAGLLPPDMLRRRYRDLVAI
jgi:hypothetical protein